MSTPVDYAKKHYSPQLRRTLEQAVADRIGEQFPRIGGPRIQALCARMVLEVIEEHVRPRETLRHGQVLWAAISRDHPPAMRARTGHEHLVPVVLDLGSSEDIDMLLAHGPRAKVFEQRCIRLCQQAYEQGAVLSDVDLAQLLSADERQIASAITCYESQSGKMLPRRATVHDVGTAITHKKIICLKHHAEGKTSNEIARETYHSMEAVDRYLGQFERVRCCRINKMSAQQTAYMLRCSMRLVKEYLEIDELLRRKDNEPLATE
jgi:hypothetical protein